MPTVAERLARYGALILIEHWRTGEVDDVVIQNHAIACGLLEWYTATERCGPDCVCARRTKLPTDCLKHPADVADYLTALE